MHLPFLFFLTLFQQCHVAHQWKKTKETNPMNIISLVEYFFMNIYQ